MVISTPDSLREGAFSLSRGTWDLDYEREQCFDVTRCLRQILLGNKPL